ncbi:hypothetical protein LYSHEL_13740 [Lysobacter helvus]|uniref:Uncharacterized protein n=2 Tax=Lysobacteraceae TaxID=32033 RepID=A0ABM7Q4U8_9GAMM|nr:hypothetical protein LYSCAS_13740 [Lysobacter caseinilyticus]BCT95503.1 hypothetical protein LYSHEL_13740 [Lysobacter helvus]
MRGEVGAHAGRQIVDDVDLVTARKMKIDKVGADETGTPGHEDVHWELSPW